MLDIRSSLSQHIYISFTTYIVDDQWYLNFYTHTIQKMEKYHSDILFTNVKNIKIHLINLINLIKVKK